LDTGVVGDVADEQITIHVSDEEIRDLQVR
jgi:hypothetical protein